MYEVMSRPPPGAHGSRPRTQRLRPAAHAWLVVMLVAGAGGCNSSMPQGIDDQFGFSALVFTSRPLPDHAGSLLLRDSFQPGGELLLLEPAAPAGRVAKLIGLQQGDVLGVDIGPDGESAVAAVRTGPGDRYHLVRVDLARAGSGDACLQHDGDLGPACARLTFGPANDTRPFHLPDGRVAFVRADPDGPTDVLNRGRARVLVAVEPDGSGLERLDTGPGDALGAGMLRSGWLQLVRSTFHGGRPALRSFRVDPSGGRGAVPEGGALQNVPVGPISGANDQVFAACVAAAGTWLAGTVCRREEEGGWSGVVAGIPAGSGCSPEGRVRDPVPLEDGRFLVSYAKVPGGCCNTDDGDRGFVPDIGIAVLDPDKGERLPVYNHPRSAEVFPRPVAARSPLDPGVELTPPDPCETGGVVMEGFVGQEMLDAGAVRMRVLAWESGALAPWSMELGGGPGGAVCGGDQDGDGRVDAWDAPVHPDGSFRLRAPAGTPLALQAVDAYGAAIDADPVWRGGPACAVRRCAACHQNDADPAGFEQSVAGLAPPAALDADASDRRSYDFNRDIQPILDRSCATSGCHDAQTAAGAYVTLTGGLRGLDLSGTPSGRTSVGYQNLLYVDSIRNDTNGRVLQEHRVYVVPGRARQSRLVQRLGVPCRWDCGGRAAWAPWGLDGDRIHPEDQPGWSGTLTDEERWTLVEWIDAGARFHGRGASP